MTRFFGDGSAVDLRRLLVRFAPGVLALFALFALFVFYASFRQQYVGACDWYGYYAEARLFLEGRLSMPLDIDISKYPAAVPLSYEEFNGRAVPQYPPGFPLLLAAGAIFGLEFFVTPLCAALSVWVMYLLLIRRVSRLVAVLMAAVWAFCPIVVWGAGSIMSDLPAALALMTCYCLLDRDRPALAGAVFVFAVAIRPTNALFGLLLLPLFGDWRRFLRFAISAAVGGAVYGLYNALLFGAPWRTGYGGGLQGFKLGHFSHHFPHYAKEILVHLTPALLLPALLAVVRRRDRSLFFLAWFLLFWVLYSFWWAGGADAWWYMRFLLPGLPGLFILAADGWEEIRRLLNGARPRWRAAVQGVFCLVAALLIAYSVAFCRQNQCFSGTTAKSFYDVAESARRVLPRNALIGAFNATGSLRLYGGFDTFRIPNLSSVHLVADTLPTGRPVYLLLEEGLREDGMMKRLLQEFEVDSGTQLEGRHDAWVVQVLGPKNPPSRAESGDGS